MIYVTHDQTEAMTMGNKIVLMKDGFVQQIDAPLRMYNYPANRFAAGFIGTPSMNFFEGSIERDVGMVFVEKDGGNRLGVHQRFHSKLEGVVGKEIVLGLRPEHIMRPGSGERTNGDTCLKVLIDLVEPLGSEILVYFTTHASGKQHVARVAASEDLRVGQSCELAFDMSKSHFFEPQTGKSI